MKALPEDTRSLSLLSAACRSGVALNGRQMKAGQNRRLLTASQCMKFRVKKKKRTPPPFISVQLYSSRNVMACTLIMPYLLGGALTSCKTS